MEKLPNYHKQHFFSSLFYLLLLVFFVLVLINNPGTSLDFREKISFFDLTLLSLAVFRITRLLVYDTIMDFLRSFLFKRSWTIQEILSCPWCTGVWISLFVGFLYLVHPIFWYLIFFVGLAGAAALLQSFTSFLLKKPEK